MMTIPFLFQVFALVCMVFAAFNLFPTARVAWGWLGLLFWFISFMVEAIGLHQASSIH